MSSPFDEMQTSATYESYGGDLEDPDFGWYATIDDAVLSSLEPGEPTRNTSSLTDHSSEASQIITEAERARKEAKQGDDPASALPHIAEPVLDAQAALSTGDDQSSRVFEQSFALSKAYVKSLIDRQAILASAAGLSHLLHPDCQAIFRCKSYLQQPHWLPRTGNNEGLKTSIRLCIEYKQPFDLMATPSPKDIELRVLLSTMTWRGAITSMASVDAKISNDGTGSPDSLSEAQALGDPEV
ncbi:hypothetical protein Q5752_001886 [Cryptotrichosporon argae]